MGGGPQGAEGSRLATDAAAGLCSCQASCSRPRGGFTGSFQAEPCTWRHLGSALWAPSVLSSAICNVDITIVTWMKRSLHVK